MRKIDLKLWVAGAVLALGLVACGGGKKGIQTIYVQAQGRTDAEGPAGIRITIAANVQNGKGTQVDVDWGDGQSGTFAQNTAITHTYTTAGSRTITVTSVGEDDEVSTTMSVLDVDLDFYLNAASGSIRGTDCNDNNAAVNPAAAETAGDGEDSNCNGAEAT